MRKLAFNPPSYLSLCLFSSNQKLQFSVSSHGQKTKHQSCLQLLQDPAKIRSLNEAKSLHALVIILGSFPTQDPVFLHINIISRYARFGDISLARKLFDEMPHRNVVSYNSMMGFYGKDGFFKDAWKLFSEMRKCDLKPTQFTYGSLLSCHAASVFQGMQLQALIEKTGLLYADACVGTALLGMYGRQGCLDEAVGVFDIMPIKNLVTWNCLISVFGQMGFIEDCILMFSDLIRGEIGLSEYTVVGVLSVLEEVDVQLGETLHGLVIKFGFDSVASVSNCLINMYAKFDLTSLAEKVFEKAVVKDIVSWNTLIGAMVDSDKPGKALDMFLKLCVTGLTPNDATLLHVLNTCSRLRFLSYGESLHAKMIKKKFETDVYSGSALVSFYAKCNKLQEAHLCFDGITEKNVVSWNSRMLGYSKMGSSFTIKLLQEMIHSGYHPNELSFSTIIKSSLHMELLQLHSLTIKMGYHENNYTKLAHKLICQKW